MLLIGPLRTNFSEILIEILTFSFKKMHLKVSSATWRAFCLNLNVLSISYLLFAGGLAPAWVVGLPLLTLEHSDRWRNRGALDGDETLTF